MNVCKTSAVVRAFAAAAILAVSTFISPVSAATVPTMAPELVASTAAVSSNAYLEQLLQEINERRAQVGTPPVAFATLDANDAVGAYLADLTPRMVSMHACFHGQNDPVAPGWDYVAASGLDGEALGEVLACPDDNGFWTTERIADGWWNSPTHFRSLYGDADANAVACGTYGPHRGGRAYQTIACVTYRI